MTPQEAALELITALFDAMPGDPELTRLIFDKSPEVEPLMEAFKEQFMDGKSL